MWPSPHLLAQPRFSDSEFHWLRSSGLQSGHDPQERRTFALPPRPRSHIQAPPPVSPPSPWPIHRLRCRWWPEGLEAGPSASTCRDGTAVELLGSWTQVPFRDLWPYISHPHRPGWGGLHHFPLQGLRRRCNRRLTWPFFRYHRRDQTCNFTPLSTLVLISILLVFNFRTFLSALL